MKNKAQKEKLRGEFQQTNFTHGYGTGRRVILVKSTERRNDVLSLRIIGIVINENVSYNVFSLVISLFLV